MKLVLYILFFAVCTFGFGVIFNKPCKPLKRVLYVLLLTVCIFVSGVMLNSIHRDESEIFVLEYGEENNKFRSAEDNDGIFYVSENSLKAEWEKGTIEILDCWYIPDKYHSLNIHARVTTSDTEAFDQLIENTIRYDPTNTAKDLLYCKVKLNGKKLGLETAQAKANYTDELVYTDHGVFNYPESYDLYMSYPCKFKTAKIPIEIDFMDITIKTNLTKMQGYSVLTDEGLAIWHKYNEEQ